MRLSARTEYAAIAVLELARRWDSGEPVRLREICDAHRVPSGFLVQILLRLKAAGIVTSTRGASGGYQLAKPPAEITLDDIRRIMDGGDDLPAEQPGGRSRAAAVLRAAWGGVAKAEAEAMQAVDFETLADRARSASEAMYYI